MLERKYIPAMILLDLLIPPQLEPTPHRSHLKLLRRNNFRRRETWSRLVGKHAVLIRVMVRSGDQDKRLSNGGVPIRNTVAVGGSLPPDVLFAVDESQTGVGKVDVAVAVDPIDVRGCRDVECFAADVGEVVEVDYLGD